jgi:hypothetical protein
MAFGYWSCRLMEDLLQAHASRHIGLTPVVLAVIIYLIQSRTVFGISALPDKRHHCKLLVRGRCCSGTAISGLGAAYPVVSVKDGDDFPGALALRYVPVLVLSCFAALLFGNVCGLVAGQVSFNYRGVMLLSLIRLLRVAVFFTQCWDT